MIDRKDKKMSLKKKGLLLAAILPMTMAAQVEVNYEAGLTANVGDSELAPHYIMANRGGVVTQQFGTLLHGAVWHTMDTTRRLSWGAGVEVWGGWASSTTYWKLNISSGSAFPIGSDDPASSSGTPVIVIPPLNHQHPARVWLQQAWVEGKYRGVQLVLGAKRHESPMVNDCLSSGDLVWSQNARPLVGARAGFVNFQTIPFTRGWVQINGEVGYYKPGDNKWLEHHYNYYNHFITTGWWMNYKYLHLRSNPNKPLVVTVGMQAACQFGGDNVFYEQGQEVRRVKQKANAEAFFKALIPGSGGSNKGDEFFEGNHLGTWDVRADYTLRGGHRLSAYHQHIWEDGSGIGFRNGFDGLWGLEYKAPTQGWVDGAVIEYIDLTNQSGPIHWAPGDHEGTPMTSETTGGDDYYNNYAFNGYQVRGMALGTPMAVAPIYNTDGYMSFVHNRVRAFHAAVQGRIGQQWQYRLMGSRRAAWGTTLMPMPKATCTSLMAEVGYAPASVQGLQVRATLATDHGSLLGDNVAGMINITYTGNFTIGRK